MIKIDVRQSKQCNGDYALFVSFPYNADIVRIIKELPTRYYDRDAREWEVPIKAVDLLTDTLEDYNLKYDLDYLELERVMNPNETKRVEYDDFSFKTKPFKHQLEAFNYGLNNDKWLLGDEQGLGKTKTVIDIAVAKKELCGYKHCLIICGVNGLKWNWVNEIHTHSNEDAHILGQRTNKKGKTTIGSNKDKLSDLNALDSILSYFIITNVESLRDESICSKISDLCTQKAIQMIATDEIHKMKNPSSQQGKAFLKLKAETMIAMTGTPLMNNPLDLYIILRWLGFEKHAFYRFKKHYCIMGGFGGYEIVGYRYLDELQDNLNDIMLRRKKEEVLDLPDKLYINEYIEMTTKQSQIYKEVTMDIKAHIDEIAISPNPLAQLIRLRQATGYTGILSSTVQESAKLDRMEELVEEAIENGKKVVIFSNWTQMTDAICDRLAQFSPAVITGNVHPDIRNSAIDMFQNLDGCKVIIGTIGAMGTGLTLTAGTVEIFMDEPWNRALYDQAVDRCHRVGQNSNVTIYNLICKNTIDERIHELVQNKGAMSDAIVDGHVVGDRMELLNYLLS